MCLCLSCARRANAQKRRAVHHAPDCRGDGIGQVAHGPPNPERGADARCFGRHWYDQRGNGSGIRRNRCRYGGRFVQVGKTEVRQPNRTSGGKFPQTDFGDDQRHARHHRQTVRSPAQYAHAGFDAVGKTPPHFTGNAGNLCPDCKPYRFEPRLSGIAGFGFSKYPSRPLPHAAKSHEQFPPQQARRGGQSVGRFQPTPRRRQYRSANQRAGKKPLQHPSENAQQTSAL